METSVINSAIISLGNDLTTVVQACVPYCITIMGVMMTPKVIKKVVSTFL